MKEQLSILCKKISEEIRCKGCGEFKDRNGNCRKCYSEDYEFKELVDELSNCLDNIILDDEILLYLHSIRFLNSEKVQAILNENNFNQFVNKKYDEITDKYISNFNLNDVFDINDLKYIFYFLEYDYYDDKQALLIANRIMGLLMNRKLGLDINYKQKIVVYFTKASMKGVYPNVDKINCVFEKRNLDFNKVFFEKVYLELDKINECLQNNKYIELLEYIFFECTLTLIYNQILHFKETSYLNLLNTKEYIIRKNFKGYYEENKERYSHNNYAIYNSCLLVYQFLKEFGWHEKYEEYLNYKKEKAAKNLSNEERVLDGGIISLDSIFDSLELNKKILDTYSILRYEYKEKDETIVRKKQEELEKEYMTYLSKHEESEETHYLFNRLISKVKPDTWFDIKE